jgi:ADP-heptose:LPS heptosyltransferase
MQALVARTGGLGDLILTRRLTYSLWRSGYRTTLLAPGRWSAALALDPWIDGVLDIESPVFAPLFAGSASPLADAEGRFDAAVSLSRSSGLAAALSEIAPRKLVIDPAPVLSPPQGGATIEAGQEEVSRTWARRCASIARAFEGDLPPLARCAQSVPEEIAIHPGSGSKTKNWPPEAFRDLAARLGKRGSRVVWILGPAETGEERSGTGISPALPPAPFSAEQGPALLSPALDALVVQLASTRLFVGNDSGVTHLAAACGRHTLALFGPTSSRIWRPDGPRVTTLDSPAGCLDQLSVDAVEETCLRLLNDSLPERDRGQKRG